MSELSADDKLDLIFEGVLNMKNEINTLKAENARLTDLLGYTGSAKEEINYLEAELELTRDKCGKLRALVESGYKEGYADGFGITYSVGLHLGLVESIDNTFIPDKDWSVSETAKALEETK